jgi:hypothetical protein
VEKILPLLNERRRRTYLRNLSKGETESPLDDGNNDDEEKDDLVGSDEDSNGESTDEDQASAE